MLMGEYNHSIDKKGRVIVPAKFRETLGEEFVISRGFDECLYAYSAEAWADMETKLKSLPLSNPKSRQITRFFLAGAANVTPDSQGRINIPENLISYAGLESQVVLVGVGNKIEIWDKAKWDKGYTEFSDINDIACEMENAGFLF